MLKTKLNFDKALSSGCKTSLKFLFGKHDWKKFQDNIVEAIYALVPYFEVLKKNIQKANTCTSSLVRTFTSD